MDEGTVDLLLRLATGRPTASNSGHCADCSASHINFDQDYERDEDGVRWVLDTNLSRFGLGDLYVESHYSGCIVNAARDALDRAGLPWRRREGKVQ